MISNDTPQLIPGLAADGIERARIPESHRVIMRGEWQPGNRSGLAKLLVSDRPLLVGLAWIQWGPEPSLAEMDSQSLADMVVDEMGVEVAREAAVAMVLFRAYRIGASVDFSHEDFWSQAFARGIAARLVDKLLGGEQVVHSFLAGFFVEFGDVVMVSADPKGYDERPEGQSMQAWQVERFGRDSSTMAWVTLRDAGVSIASYGGCLLASRRERSLGVFGQAKSHRASRGFALALLIGRMIVSEAAERMRLWKLFVSLRNERELTRDRLNEVCDDIVNQWWDWGELLGTPVRTLPGFGALSEWNERGVEPIRFNSGTDWGVTSPVDVSGEAGLDILLVENDPATGTGIALMVRSAGHNLRVVRSGEEAMDAICQRRPQVVLADWHMEGTNGLDLCANLRRTEFGQRIFFILLTENSDQGMIGSAYRVGINDFVQKHGPAVVLLARITAAWHFLARWEAVDRDRRIIRAHCEHSRHVAALMKADSRTDTLTGLPNRRFAMERLREEWSRTERVAKHMSVVMLDIDHFKAVNDNFGHDVGDVVLRETAQIIQSVTRRNEAACRIGGEEFLIICSEATLAQAASCAERVRAAIEANIVKFGNFDRNVTVSLGVAQRTAAMPDTDALIKGADEAIFAAKEDGRNNVALWPSLQRARFVGERLAG